MLNKDELGQMCPPWTPPGCDRAAHYAGPGETYYDAHYRLIEPGKPLKVAAPSTPHVDTDVDQTNYTPARAELGSAETQLDIETVIAQPDPYTAASLLDAVDSIAWPLLQKEAKRILGATCPAGKSNIINALSKAVAGYSKQKAKQAERNATIGKGVPAQASEPGDSTVVAPPPNKKPGAVDLRAWAIGPGRPGGKDYLFAEVRKAIRQTYSTQIAGKNERADAVDFLIKTGVVTADEARGDVYQ